MHVTVNGEGMNAVPTPQPPLHHQQLTNPANQPRPKERTRSTSAWPWPPALAGGAAVTEEAELRTCRSRARSSLTEPTEVKRSRRRRRWMRRREGWRAGGCGREGGCVEGKGGMGGGGQ